MNVSDWVIIEMGEKLDVLGLFLWGQVGLCHIFYK